MRENIKLNVVNIYTTYRNNPINLLRKSRVDQFTPLKKSYDTKYLLRAIYFFSNKIYKLTLDLLIACL